MGRWMWTLGAVLVLIVVPAVSAPTPPSSPELHGSLPLAHKYGRETVVVGLSTPEQCRGLLTKMPDGSTGGFGREICGELGRVLGLRVEFKELAGSDQIAMLNGGEVDAVCLMTVLDDRLERVAFTAPVVVARGALFMRPGEQPPHDLAEFSKLRISVASYGVAHQWCVSHGLAVKSAFALREALLDVVEGRADVCVTTQLTGRVDLERFQISGLVEHPLNDGGLWRSYAVAVRNGDADLLTDLNAGLAILRQNGRFDELYDRWVGPFQPREAPRMVAKSDAVAVAAVLIAIAAAWCLAWVLSARLLRKRTADLAARERELSSIADYFPGVFYKYTLTDDGQRIPGYVNAHAASWERAFESFKLFGDYRQTLLPRMHPDDRSRYIAATTVCRDTRTALDIEYRLLDRDMRYHWIHSRIVPIPIDGGMVWQGMLLDVTELRTAQAERHRLAEQLVQAQRLESLGLMAGGIAHDFNNLVTALGGQLDLASNKLPANNAAATHIEAARGAIRRAGELARQLLTFSGKDPLRKSDVDLVESVRALTPLLGTMVPPGVVIDFETCSKTVTCPADPPQLEQVVMNLVTNAAEACGPAGSVRIKVDRANLDAAAISLCVLHGDAKPGEFARLSVADNGPGINPESLARIFEPFFSTKLAGRGLGLSVVATIVKRHAGAIRITSKPGEGTDFEVFFPASVAASTPEPSPSSSHETPARGRVLVVDAKASIRQITAQMLETKGWTCVQAGDLCSAVEALAASPESFGLVVLDSEGDSPSSIQAVERLREVRPQLPCLFMTSIPQPAIGQTPAQTIRLQRPFSAAQLSHAASALTQPGSNT